MDINEHECIHSFLLTLHGVDGVNFHQIPRGKDMWSIHMRVEAFPGGTLLGESHAIKGALH
jgi:hypothetical protein